MKCSDCKKRNKKITFCNSMLEYSHGFTILICRQCYIKRLEKTNKINTEQIKLQKKLIKDGK